jgi:hypothetical protein
MNNDQPLPPAAELDNETAQKLLEDAGRVAATEEIPVEDLYIGLALAGLLAGYAFRGEPHPMLEVVAKEAVQAGRLTVLARSE